MDCEQVRELLDAYALGASDAGEGDGLEEHVADCVRCWEELTKSQQTAAMLALAIPIETPPEYLERRVMAQAEVQRPPAVATASGGLFSRLNLGWPATAGALAVASVVALAFAAVLQVQLTDIRSENDDLQTKVQADASVIDDMQEIMTVAFSDDVDTTELAAVSGAALGAGTALYGWSRKHLSGFILCDDLPTLGDENVYQAWFHAGDAVVSAATFAADDGTCHIPVHLSSEMPLTGFGISIEPTGGSSSPSSDWLMYASFGD